MQNTIVVFTSKTVEEILVSGGSQYWRLKPSHAAKMKYLVCTRNAKESQGPEPHGSGFLIGRIGGIAQTEEPSRFLIKMSDYATIEAPDLWVFGRNPVHYTDISKLDIDLNGIELKPVANVTKPDVVPPPDSRIRPLTISEAKRGLALTFGVTIDAIDITIRG